MRNAITRLELNITQAYQDAMANTVSCDMAIIATGSGHHGVDFRQMGYRCMLDANTGTVPVH